MKIDKNGLCLALTLMVSSLGFGYDGTWTQDGVTFDYTVSNGEVCVSLASCGESMSVEVPSEINGYKVTSIGRAAFSGCTSLKSVTIPDSVTTIGDYAFEDCTGLSSVTIPNSVTSIGDGLFYDCNGLTSVTMPNNVASIGGKAFYGCRSLDSVRIPGNVTSIGEYAFCKCDDLTSVAIPSSVTSIGGMRSMAAEVSRRWQSPTA